MIVNALIKKTQYGHITLDIPDEKLENCSDLAKKRRVSKYVEAALADNATQITYDTDNDVSYDGFFVPIEEIAQNIEDAQLEEDVER